MLSSTIFHPTLETLLLPEYRALQSRKPMFPLGAGDSFLPSPPAPFWGCSIPWRCTSEDPGSLPPPESQSWPGNCDSRKWMSQATHGAKVVHWDVRLRRTAYQLPQSFLVDSGCLPGRHQLLSLWSGPKSLSDGGGRPQGQGAPQLYLRELTS